MRKKNCMSANYAVLGKDHAGPLPKNLNENVLVIGGTSSGKTVSTAMPTVMHTDGASIVLTVTKKKTRKLLTKFMEKRGYKVYNLDLADPDNSDVGYDPLRYVQTDEDVLKLAEAIVKATNDKKASKDPFWDKMSKNFLAALMLLVVINAREAGRCPSMCDVVDLYNHLKIDNTQKLIRTNLDDLFEASNRIKPNNLAIQLWNSFTGLAEVTASCVHSEVGTYLAIFTEKVMRMMRNPNPISFEELGREKTLLTITTSPMNKALQPLINVMYGDLFAALFEEAEQREDSRLKVPVRVVCDDFATGGRIPNFAEYISIFRAAGISVMLLLQSESQLTGMYEREDATTIINNCDTYVYMGGNDLDTCRSVSMRANKPLNRILTMESDKVLIFQRGSEPVFTERYATFEDPLYREMLAENEEAEPERG